MTEWSAGPGYWPGSEPIEVAETHSAAVFFVFDRAYKLKKPIDLGFLDFRDPHRRRQACEDEVVLNQRLAPDVYLGVAEVRGPDGAPCEWMVVMRRLPAERKLARLVTDERSRTDPSSDRPPVDVEAQVRALARQLAAFHSAARRSPAIADAGRAPALMARWRDNLVVLRAHSPRVLRRELVERIAEQAQRYVAGRSVMLDARADAGLVVDGHGDLLADDIFCLDDGPRALDCLDFDPALRAVDGLDDAAFLAMDLERLGAADLGGRFLTWYQEFTGSPAAATLVHHYLAYRAGVRAKVACLRADQGGGSAVEDARWHLELAARHLAAGDVPLVLVGGLPGTGKSTLAGQLADQLGAVLVRSDVVRKEAPTPRSGVTDSARVPPGWRKGRYAPEVVAATYRVMMDRARILLASGEPVVVDASWSSSEERSTARRVAADASSPVVELHCVAPADVATARIDARREASHRGITDPSEATEAIARHMAGVFDPWPEAVQINTDRTLAVVVGEAIRWCRPGVDERPVPFGGVRPYPGEE